LCSTVATPGVDATKWPSELDTYSYVVQLGALLKAGKKKIGENVKLTIASADSEARGCDPTCEEEAYDILVFPDMIKLRAVRTSQLEEVVDQLLIQKLKPVDTNLDWCAVDFKAAIMVCAHSLRDKRCGVAGPLLCNEFDGNTLVTL
jgi:hypothetical protein